MNITDEDGDTPLYVVESVDMAQWLVEHGAEVYHRNTEGLTVWLVSSPIFHHGF